MDDPATSLLAMVVHTDDNGIVTIIQDDITPESARILHATLEARGHKQFYTIETYEPGFAKIIQKRLGAIR